MPPGAYGQPGPVAAPEPLYPDDWHTPAPEAGASWDLSPSPAAPPGAAAADPWHSAAAYGAPSANGAPAAYGQPSSYGAPLPFDGHGGAELDSRYDTGHGWSIVSSGAQDDPSRSYIRLHAVRPARGALAYRILGDLTRLTFNMTLLAIILTILAIPTAIGISRVTGVNIPVPWHVAVPTPRPIPTPYPGYKTYRTANFNVAYPSGWALSALRDPPSGAQSVQGESFVGPGGASLIVSTIQAMPQDQLVGLLETTAPAVLDVGAANFQVIVTPRVGPKLDGTQWLYEEFTFDATNGKQAVNVHAGALAANRGVHTYLIMFAASSAQFAAAEAQYFTPMLASFHFSS
jgi:hypothetical protein